MDRNQSGSPHGHLTQHPPARFLLPGTEHDQPAKARVRRALTPGPRTCARSCHERTIGRDTA